MIARKNSRGTEGGTRTLTPRGRRILNPIWRRTQTPRTAKKASGHAETGLTARAFDSGFTRRGPNTVARLAVHDRSCARQTRREARELPPGSPPHCGGTFQCATCKREVGWCKGAWDDLPDDCNECANALHDAVAAGGVR